MNNQEQYQQIIDEAYNYYSKEYEKDNSVGLSLLIQRVDGKATYRKPDKERFVAMCTYDNSFSERWGLKIEEKELSYEERQDLYFKLNPEFRLMHESMIEHMIKHNIPTKLTTITYNDRTIESYD